jgi:hypothetical protein
MPEEPCDEMHEGVRIIAHPFPLNQWQALGMLLTSSHASSPSLAMARWVRQHQGIRAAS